MEEEEEKFAKLTTNPTAPTKPSSSNPLFSRPKKKSDWGDVDAEPQGKAQPSSTERESERQKEREKEAERQRQRQREREQEREGGDDFWNEKDQKRSRAQSDLKTQPSSQKHSSKADRDVWLAEQRERYKRRLEEEGKSFSEK